jgi:hypothetical protein
MTGPKTLVAAALISTISAAPVLADEPAAFQAQYPNRDVLNGGELTPAGRLGLELPGGGGTGSAGPSSAAERYRPYGPVTNTFRGHGGRRHRSR